MRLLLSALTALVLSCTLLTPAHAASPIEDYASYREPGKCHPKPYAGTVVLGHLGAPDRAGLRLVQQRRAPQ